MSEDLKAVMHEEFETETLFLVENESSAAYLDLRYYHDELGVFDCYRFKFISVKWRVGYKTYRKICRIRAIHSEFQ